jgi:hypothetical protein
MPFPSPGEALPSLTTGQMHFRGVSFGGMVPGSAYQLKELPTGLDNAPISSSDAQRPLDQGGIAGLDVYEPREITLTQLVKADTISLDHARQALGAIMVPTGATEYPFYVQLPSGLFACMARARKHNYAYDINFVFAQGDEVHSAWKAMDPRWYGTPTKTATVGLPAPSKSKGIVLPASEPFVFGGGSAGGILEGANNGTFEMRPVLTITGPCKNPSVQSLLIPGEPTLAFNLTLDAGDTLLIETDYQRLTYTPAGAPFGAPARKALRPGSTWFNLPPGPFKWLFTTQDTAPVAGTLTAEWADAYANL